MYRKYAKLDVVPGGELQRFYISEDDDRSRHLVFGLFASVGDLDLPADAQATLECEKPDGAEVKVSGVRDNLAITFDLPVSVAEIPGDMMCNVVLTSGDRRLYTEAFILVVDNKTRKEE